MKETKTSLPPILQQNQNELEKEVPPPDYGTGVLQQNLFLHDSTLNIKQDLTVDETFKGRSLTVSGQTNILCPLQVGNNLSAKNASLKETNISNNITVNLSEKQKCKFENIQHPKNRYDAMTWGYLKTRAIESMSYFQQSRQKLPKNTLNPIPFSMTGVFNKNDSPSAGQCFLIDGYKLYLLRVGIYQVSVNVARYGGRHNGNDEQDMQLTLCTGSDRTPLSFTDSRGLGRNDPTIRTLYGVFSVLSIDPKNPKNVWVEMSVYGAYFLESVATNAIWFPLNADFTGKD